jgi:hypothetical protein
MAYNEKWRLNARDREENQYDNEFDALEKNIQYWYMTYQNMHKKITDAYINKASAKEIDFFYNDKEYRNAITQLQRVKKKYGTIDITDIKDLHR